MFKKDGSPTGCFLSGIMWSLACLAYIVEHRGLVWSCLPTGMAAILSYSGGIYLVLKQKKNQKETCYEKDN